MLSFRMEGASPDFVLVPYTELTAELLRAVIEAFVLREGTDYGDRELSLDEKVARMMAQLKSGEANIVFDPESESVTIQSKSQTAKPVLTRDQRIIDLGSR
jgi:uncharacterized protein YheU (UPF0270 family)